LRQWPVLKDAAAFFVILSVMDKDDEYRASDDFDDHAKAQGTGQDESSGSH
jgi:hypothetical protein